MVVGRHPVLFMDEISTGLDSSSTFLITKALKNLCSFLKVKDFEYCVVAVCVWGGGEWGGEPGREDWDFIPGSAWFTGSVVSVVFGAAAWGSMPLIQVQVCYSLLFTDKKDFFPMQINIIIALLQPAPETYELFDDVLFMGDKKECECAQNHAAQMCMLCSEAPLSMQYGKTIAYLCSCYFCTPHVSFLTIVLIVRLCGLRVPGCFRATSPLRFCTMVQGSKCCRFSAPSAWCARPTRQMPTSCKRSQTRPTRRCV